MFADEILLELPTDVRLTGLGLRFFANESGRQTANPILLKGSLYPLTDEVTTEVIDGHLLALEYVGYIQLYTVNKRTYFQVVDWPSVDKRGIDMSRVPPPPPDPSITGQTNPDTSIQTLAVVEREEERREERGREGEREESAEGAGEAPQGARSSLLGTPKPSPFCTKHPRGTNRPCQPCGRARLLSQEWVEAEIEAADLEELGEAS
ncbi:hypothetical protein [Promicromonospora umidemergens]|nr:hypothetical protein [Promicromonospora umidemergens]